MKGKEIRLRHLFKNSQRVFIVPMDHGVSVGPMDGIEDIRQAVKAVAEGGADAVIVHKGLAKQVTPYVMPGGCELIIHLSASTALSPEPNKKELVSSLNYAIRMGATAVSAHVNLAGSSELQMLKDLSSLAEQCDLWGMPLLAMMYVRDGNKESEYDYVKIRHAARVAEEIGADIVKVNYTGSPETFAEVTRAVSVPVVIAGGPKMGSTAELLKMVADALEAGGRGVAIGRNIFQDRSPAQLARAVRQIMDSDFPREVLKELSLPEQ
ncbi:MAG: 2-amino-3,7-dideoxy-D-threo-hept-6-ulosonate synthase [Bacillota bacterium]